MKITKSRLVEIIKEVINEVSSGASTGTADMTDAERRVKNAQDKVDHSATQEPSSTEKQSYTLWTLKKAPAKDTVAYSLGVASPDDKWNTTQVVADIPKQASDSGKLKSLRNQIVQGTKNAKTSREASKTLAAFDSTTKYNE